MSGEQKRLNEWVGAPTYHGKREAQVSLNYSLYEVELWTAWAEVVPERGLAIYVEAGPSADPDAACEMVIKRLAIAGVDVP